MNSPHLVAPDQNPPAASEGLSLLDLMLVIAENLRLVAGGALASGIIALGITYLIPPVYTARTSFLPPAQSQSAAASALASLSNLAGFGAGSGAGPKTLSDQYASLMQSLNVADQLIDKFKLLEAYEVATRTDARMILAENLRVGVGKRDGMLGVEVDDRNPVRAAEMANAVVDELRRLTNTLTVTEAQQRRVFFENQLKQVRNDLARAQRALQVSGIDQAALKAEPRTAAEAYGRLKAEVTNTEIRLQTLRATLSDETPEVRQQMSALTALKAQLARAESASQSEGGEDYVSRYREFKYQETMFELIARQYEVARVDESREGALIQVVDVATPPERKSKPRRAVVAGTTTVLAGFALMAFVILRHLVLLSATDHATAEKLRRLRQTFGAR